MQENIWTINETEHPVFIATFNAFDFGQNYLAVIMYDRETHSLSASWRVRYERDLTKNIHRLTRSDGGMDFPFCNHIYESLKKGIRYTFASAINVVPNCSEIKELEIPHNAKLDKIYKQIEKSQLFDITKKLAK